MIKTNTKLSFLSSHCHFGYNATGFSLSSSELAPK